ncbi:MAG TPA: HAMP domain-containing sensor histidine kinase [Vicinamibacterales bacterium]|nr:HAMP domain-containing sensor histidine kinase [Vicinamibacterales bacterium]
MKQWMPGPRSALVLGLCLSAAALIGIGYRAVTGWQRSAQLLAARRAESAADLVVTAVTRDMRAAQATVLPQLRPDDVFDLRDRIASAFARYPYPEAFFAWRGSIAASAVTVYCRSDRAPEWVQIDPTAIRLPVVMGHGGEGATRLIDRLRKDVALGRRFSAFDLALGGIPHQVIASIRYNDAFHEAPAEVVGFTVNLDWVRRHYFDELTRQVAPIAGGGNGLTVVVIDGRGSAVDRAPRGVRPDASARRTFPLMFFDPILAGVDAAPDIDPTPWAAEAIVADDPTLATANQGAGRTLTVAAISAATLALALILTVRAARASAALAAMRSDFVATVTHELKTPIATIRAISETLASGRSTTTDMSREYAQMAVHEAKRLTRLIDNLLAYSRVTDVTEMYSFEATPPEVVVHDVLREFGSQLKHDGFDVRVDVPHDLPLVSVDHTAIGLLLGNVIDNAVRHGGHGRYLGITARREANAIAIEISDHGAGIPEHELPQVTRRFFRGRQARPGGSGLGLAIAQRIVTDHGGSLAVRSAIGRGTTVVVALPMAVGQDERRHSEERQPISPRYRA